MYVGRSDGLDNPGGDIVLVFGKSEAELKVVFFLQIRGRMSMLSISQLNQKKVSPPGLSLSFSYLVLTAFPDVLINDIACR